MLREEMRLEMLYSLEVDYTTPDHDLDGIAALASTWFNAPMASITLIDRDTQWFKARIGFDLERSNREHSFCNHAIQLSIPMVVCDSLLDARFESNPLVVGPPHIRFYAGAPIQVYGENIGALCVLDQRPRAANPGATQALEILAGLAATIIKLNANNRAA
ncbi:MAG: GAF domain-containing protein [Fimbriimonadaceae bacterium]